MHLFYPLNFLQGLSGWSICRLMKQWALLSISFLTKYPPKAWFSFHSFWVFPCTEIAVNDNRYFILKSHNMLLSFIGTTLPEELSLELRLQFSFCFFERLRPCYYISFGIVLCFKLRVAIPPPYLIRLSFFHFANLSIKIFIYTARQSIGADNRGKSLGRYRSLQSLKNFKNFYWSGSFFPTSAIFQINLAKHYISYIE